MKKSIISLFLVCLSLFLSQNIALAAAPNPAGLTVSPAIEQINLNKGQTSTSFNNQLVNNTKSSLIVYVSTTDFTALNQNGGVLFYNNAQASSSLHGLAKSIKPTATKLVLPAGASQTVPINIPNTAKLAPGGHYGAVIYRATPSGSASKGNRVSTVQEVSSLVFLTTYNSGTQSVRLDPVPWGSYILKLPTTLNLVFTNNGNTQTAARGVVTITDSSSHEVARGIVNVGSGLVLPGTSRLYTINLRSEKAVLYPGIYKLHISYSADGASTTSTYTKKFLIINEQIAITAIILGLALIIVLVRWIGPKVVYRLRQP